MKKITRILLLVLLLSLCSMPVNAASKNHMKKVRGITWDLKKGKKIKYHCYYTGLGGLNETMQITSIKTKKTAGKKNYLTTAIKIIFDERMNLTPAQVDTITKAAVDGVWGNYPYVTAVDYHTGYCLEGKNSFHVKAEMADPKWYQSKTCYGSYYWEDGKQYRRSVTLSKGVTTLTVTYPKKYDGLCILAGGSTKLTSSFSKKDLAFFDGGIPFGITTAYYSKTDKKYCHGMRIRAK